MRNGMSACQATRTASHYHHICLDHLASALCGDPRQPLTRSTHWRRAQVALSSAWCCRVLQQVAKQ